MTRHAIAYLFTAFLFLSCASVIAQEKQQLMTNSDVVKMVQSGISESAIIRAIQEATPNFEINHDAIVALREQKVPDQVILAMVRRQNSIQLLRKTQAPSHHPAPSDIGPKWEIEFHGGISRSHQTGGWTNPPAAETYSLSGSGAKGLTSIRVSSWYFGDGAKLIGLSSSLDSILTKSAVQPQGQIFGFRASRTLTKRIAVEFTFDYSGRFAIRDDRLAQIEAARVSFKNLWSRLDVPGNSPTSSVSTVSAYGGHQIFTTGAIVINLLKARRVIPFVTVGAGVLSSGGSTPGVTLVGSYGGPTALETDSVRLTFAQAGNRVFAQVLGGGAKIYLTPHLGIRLDARAYLYNNPFISLLDATHTNTPDAAWVVKASSGTSTPFLQLLSGSGLSAYSTLSGPAISGLKTFFGVGGQRQIPITLGFFWRF